ncbi:hypothetical protein CLF_100404 [Clonorchis sinensis]|uniref:Uncharacterized protein n=1 Tax=Clonorchis sinensis TaxID=79923 RepID=G7Y3D2_CLOSI|nr:hypothetical protein CLF_100404 [Clonorchis sinensis]
MSEIDGPHFDNYSTTLSSSRRKFVRNVSVSLSCYGFTFNPGRYIDQVNKVGLERPSSRGVLINIVAIKPPALEKASILVDTIAFEICERIECRHQVLVFNEPDRSPLEHTKTAILTAFGMLDTMCTARRPRQLKPSLCCPIILQFRDENDAELRATPIGDSGLEGIPEAIWISIEQTKRLVMCHINSCRCSKQADTFTVNGNPVTHSTDIKDFGLRYSCTFTFSQQVQCQVARAQRTDLRHYFFLVYYTLIWSSLPDLFRNITHRHTFSQPVDDFLTYLAACTMDENLVWWSIWTPAKSGMDDQVGCYPLPEDRTSQTNDPKCDVR